MKLMNIIAMTYIPSTTSFKAARILPQFDCFHRSQNLMRFRSFSFSGKLFAHRRSFLPTLPAAWTSSNCLPGGGSRFRIQSKIIQPSPSSFNLSQGRSAYLQLQHHPCPQHYQNRMYHVNPYEANDDSNAEEEPITKDQMERNNLITRRLYRILLRSCTRGVKSSNEQIQECVNPNNLILLQPPMDHRRYGFAKVYRARRGDVYERAAQPESDGNDTMESDIAVGKHSIVDKLSRDDISMAMEVLRFVHVSLGGDADDDLEDYYLGGSFRVQHFSGDDNSSQSDSNISDNAISTKDSGAAAGTHSQGHYTQFLDDEDEDDTNDDMEDENMNWEGTEEEEMQEMDPSVLVTSNDLKNAVRIAFRAPLVSLALSNEEMQPLPTIIKRRHRDAISVSSLLSEQFQTWGGKSSITVDWERGVRVVATSFYHGRAPHPGGNLDSRKYSFVYRIRVENISDLMEVETVSKGEDSQTSESGQTPPQSKVFQLLGRTWKISECGAWPSTSLSQLSQILEKDGMKKEVKEYEGMDKEDEYKVVNVVDQPKTGAVGYFPVIHPGEVFEYMSGVQLSTPKGAMEGCFHMAFVDGETTDTAFTGEPVDALLWKSNDERKFEVPVGRFGFNSQEKKD